MRSWLFVSTAAAVAVMVVLTSFLKFQYSVYSLLFVRALAVSAYGLTISEFRAPGWRDGACYLVFRAVLSAGAVGLFFLNIVENGPVVATVFHSQVPVLSVLLAVFFAGAKLNLRQVIGVVACIAGGLVAAVDTSGALDFSAIALGFGGAVCGAASFLMLKKSTQFFGDGLILVSSHLLLMVAGALGPFSPGHLDLSWPLFLFAASCVTAQHLLVRSYRKLPVTVSSMTLVLAAVIASVWKELRDSQTNVGEWAGVLLSAAGLLIYFLPELYIRKRSIELLLASRQVR